MLISFSHWLLQYSHCLLCNIMSVFHADELIVQKYNVWLWIYVLSCMFAILIIKSDGSWVILIGSWVTEQMGQWFSVSTPMTHCLLWNTAFCVRPVPLSKLILCVIYFVVNERNFFKQSAIKTHATTTINDGRNTNSTCNPATCTVRRCRVYHNHVPRPVYCSSFSQDLPHSRHLSRSRTTRSAALYTGNITSHVLLLDSYSKKQFINFVIDWRTYDRDIAGSNLVRS